MIETDYFGLRYVDQHKQRVSIVSLGSNSIFMLEFNDIFQNMKATYLYIEHDHFFHKFSYSHILMNYMNS